ncbi:glycoside hydrolase family 28 protein [Didymella exigua CBS 183.55]|uniref:endo-polygalacturonase n=1 Tax=Didymella exigua CBS 183.55 TaxID=1150837 RepID=A0A6A5R8K4_9PLEO|nr:glycoside hydrolase family 28 protein [Didymella exigua CBS 183.55]KAF1923036.1 glycoside hydrolase family 28 protein [Didymella exigua CBS 183.55]
MVSQNLSLLLSVLVATANAAPAAEASLSDTVIAKRASACSFTGTVDVTKVAAALPTCSSVTFNAVTVPAGKTLDLSKLADNTAVNFQGTSTFLVQKGFAGPLVNIGGKNIVVTGAAGAVLDGQGAQYWDGQGSNGATPKPKFLAAHSLTGTSAINNLKLLNTPVQAVSINGCDGLKINKMTIDNSASDGLASNKMAHNTDGFDIGASSNIVIDGAVVHNQDDCVAINSGTGITFQNGKCTGGHGLSVGSVGHGSTTASNTVSNVKFLSSSVTNSANGIRVKSFFDGTGKIDAVTYSGITLSGITGHGILIEQNYDGGDLSKTHGPGSGVPITGLTISGITGTGGVTSSGTNVAIECASCTGWTWNSVAVTGGSKFSCVGEPSVIPAGVCA